RPRSGTAPPPQPARRVHASTTCPSTTPETPKLCPHSRGCTRSAVVPVPTPDHIRPMSRKTDPFAIDLTPELIVRAYQAGIFPMAEDASSTDLFWVSPQQRGIIPLDSFH